MIEKNISIKEKRKLYVQLYVKTCCENEFNSDAIKRGHKDKTTPDGLESEVLAGVSSYT